MKNLWLFYFTCTVIINNVISNAGSGQRYGPPPKPGFKYCTSWGINDNDNIIDFDQPFGFGCDVTEGSNPDYGSPYSTCILTHRDSATNELLICTSSNEKGPTPCTEDKRILLDTVINTVTQQYTSTPYMESCMVTVLSGKSGDNGTWTLYQPRRSSKRMVSIT